MDKSQSRGTSKAFVDGEVMEVLKFQFEPITEVVIDVLAAMKIVKHCNDSAPTLVSGSLLGLDHAGVLEVTYVYPLPAPQSRTDADGDVIQDDNDGGDYQTEMMKMLQRMSVDNNCVGWYTSMYFESMCTTDVVNYQFSFQSCDEFSDNSVFIMYDPLQSKKGSLVIKAFRLSGQFVEMRRNKLNDFVPPASILQELPVKIKSTGHVSSFLRSIQDTHSRELDLSYESLSFSKAEVYTERSLELVGLATDDLLQEQQRMQLHARISSKQRAEHVRWINKRIAENAEILLNESGQDLLSLDLKEAGLKPLPDVPPRLDHLLALGQIDRYCEQISQHVGSNTLRLSVAAHCSTGVADAVSST